MTALGEELAKKFRRLMELRERRDADKLAAERSEREYREAEAETWEAYDESPLEGAVKIDLGGDYGVVTFQPKETYYGRIIDRDKALEHFENRAMIDEVTEPKPVMARIHEIVRDAIDQGQQPPPGLDFYAKRYIAITRKKG